ncbi:glycosyltransferase family 2 protein [bacterium]|nr:glycosyltransferase family 2 protein [bacterium]
MNDFFRNRVELTALVICRNEAENIGPCLKSLSFADEIVVVDSGSTDNTLEIAGNYNVNLFVTEWKGYAETKQYGLDRAHGKWILWLDADERITPELALEIKKTIKDDSQINAAFKIPRRAYFLGRWIKHSGWYPGYVVRLFKKERCHFGNELVHEQLIVNGSIAVLKNNIDHYTDTSIEHYFNKFNRYTSLAAEELANRGQKASLFTMIVRSMHIFFKMYFLKEGFLDGIQGLILVFFSSFYVFVKYAKLWEINSNCK